jgi:hypothetical protein
MLPMQLLLTTKVQADAWQLYSQPALNSSAAQQKRNSSGAVQRVA